MLDPSSVLISSEDQKIVIHSPVMLEELRHLEILRGHKISLFETLLAPELRIHQQQAKPKSLFSSSGDNKSSASTVASSNPILWSLGLILYNLLTGEALNSFKGVVLISSDLFRRLPVH